MKTKTLSFLTLATFLSTAAFSTLAQEKTLSKKSISLKIRTSLPYVLMNANNLTSWVRSDGSFPAIVNQSWNGEFPKGSGVGTVYQEGIVFGGKVHDGVYADSIRFAGNTDFIGMQAGSIQTNASGNTIGVDNPNDLSVRAFAVRPDVPASIQNDTSAWPDLRSDAASYFQKSKDSVTSNDVQQIAAQYFKDWTEWPARKGAPWFIDSIRNVRNDAAYDPTNPHHIPGIPDAAKTIWFVCNDLDQAISAQFAGSPPIGIEEQVTLWAFVESSTYEPINNVIFKQVRLIYKGNPGAANNSRIDSMYISQWDDSDIGDSGDDYAGCDSSLNLGFTYNSTTYDAAYAPLGLKAPANGYVFLQGSAHWTGNLSDSAIMNFRWRKGYRSFAERPMSAFSFFGPGSPWPSPFPGNGGAQMWFNLMRGYMPFPGYPGGTPFYASFSYPVDHKLVSNYVCSGDPTSGAGWVDGVDISAGDRKSVEVHGPTILNLHDTAEVVIALMDGLGANNHWSLEILKYYAGFAKYWFSGMATPSSLVTSVTTNRIPRTFEVSQNYPNPFNPTTTMQFTVPNDGRATLKVYNTLGQKVATLFDGAASAGEYYQATFDGSRFASGIYFARLQFGGQTLVKKLLMTK